MFWKAKVEDFLQEMWSCTLSMDWPRQALKRSLLKILKCDFSTGEDYKNMFSIKEWKENFMDLMRKWSADSAILRLLLEALRKILLSNENDTGRELAKVLLGVPGHEDITPVEHLCSIFFMESTDFEVKILICKLLLETVKLANDIDDIMRIKLVTVAFEGLSRYGAFVDVALVSLELLRHSLRCATQHEKRDVLREKNQKVLIEICEKHGDQGICSVFVA